MTVRVFVPRDSAALAVGADEVAAALVSACARRGEAIELVRNGTRGLFWLEPLVEVETPAGRVGYGPVEVDDVESLLDAGLLHGGHHALAQGLVDAIPYLAKQQRLTFARMGVTDPLSLVDYEAHDGWVGLRRALTMTGAALVDEVTLSGLRGRGGAAFPTGIKWKTVLATSATQKYIACNADEGDSGTFSDRMTMEGDPYLLIEGMTIAGLAVGATRGYVYIRSEYPHAIATMREAVQPRDRRRGISATTFSIRAAPSASRSARARALTSAVKRPRCSRASKASAVSCARSRRCRRFEGLFGQPTVINNVISFASVPIIVAKGAAFYRDYGMGRSRGTLALSASRQHQMHGGLVELAFGVTLRELLFDYGGGSRSGRPIKAVQVGGPLGAYIPESQWDLPLDYEAYAAVGGVVGHGGIVVHDDTADMAQLARYAMEFCAIESCGKCTPCRIGSTRGVEVIDRIVTPSAKHPRTEQVRLLRDLCDTMLYGSLCAMGGMTPYPVVSALDHYPDGFRDRRRRRGARPIGRRSTSSRPEGAGANTMITELRRERDYGTPTRTSTEPGHADDRRLRGDGGQGHVADARGRGSRHQHPQALRHRQSRAVRLVPPVPGRDRRTQGLSGVVHHARGVRHVGAHAESEAAGPAQGRDGALHQRSSARLPDLQRQRRLRIAGHGRRDRAAQRALRRRCGGGTASSRRRRRTSRTRTSPTTRASASSAIAACARARKRRARSR